MEGNSCFIPATGLSQRDWTALLPQSRGQVHLDLGTGLAHFMEAMASLHPDSAWLGLELDGAVTRRAVRRLDRAGLANCRIFKLDARRFLFETAPAASLDHIWINFPDPWPKDRHAERRHTRPWMIRLMLSRLRPGGAIHLATDVGEYMEQFELAMEECAEASGLHEGPWLRGALPVQTKYERKWLRAGRPVYYGDWQLAAPVDMPTVHQVPDPGIVFPDGPPVAGETLDGDFLCKVFARKPAEEGSRLLLIDRRHGLSTMAQVDPGGRITLHGTWTAWKSRVLQAAGARPRPGG